MALERYYQLNLTLLKRVAVKPMTSAAVEAFSALFHKIDAQPSGEITE